MQPRRLVSRVPKYLICGLLSGLGLAAAAETQPASDAITTETAPAEQSAPADKPKMVCRREKVTGSAVPKRTCHTQQQADELRRASQEHLDRINQAEGVNQGGSGGG